MKEHTLNTIKKRSVTGVIITGGAQAVSLAGGFVLSILLDPTIFGIYTIVVASAVFLGYFSDIGLAAALIQKKDKISAIDLATTFTIQQMLVGGIVIVALAVSGWIGSSRGFPPDALLLFRILVISFFFSSLKTIPSILLERDLQFQKLVIPQIAEVIVFNIVVITLVALGWGVQSFTFGVLARGIVGVIAVYSIRPWMPRFAFEMASARRLVSFGMPFQLNSIIALVKDNIFIMVLPLMIPLSDVGYIGWAKKWAEVPLRLLMDNIVRITFPAYSRLQEDSHKLSRGIEKTLFFLLLLIIPMSIGMVIMIRPLVSLIPYYEKWLPALPSFYLFVIASAVAGISTPVLNALNAIGKIGVSLKFMILWTLMQWTIAPILILTVGFNGFAITTVIMTLTTVFVVRIAQRSVPFSVIKNIVPSCVAGIGMGLVMVVLKQTGASSPFMLIIWGIAGCMVYATILYVGFRSIVLSELSSLLRILKS